MFKLFFFIITFFMTHTKSGFAQKLIRAEYSYKNCGEQTLIRKWLNDSTYLDKIYVKKSLVFSEKYFIKGGEISYIKNGKRYSYFCSKSFHNRDTIYEFNDIIKSNPPVVFVRYIPMRKDTINNIALLVYKIVNIHSDSNTSYDELYFDEKRHLITGYKTFECGEAIIRKIKYSVKTPN